MKQKNLCMVCIMLSLQKLTFYIFFHPMVMKEIEWENCSIIIQSRVTVYLELIPLWQMKIQNIY